MLARGTGSCTVGSSNDTCSDAGRSARAESKPTNSTRSSTVRSGKYHHSWRSLKRLPCDRYVTSLRSVPTWYSSGTMSAAVTVRQSQIASGKSCGGSLDGAIVEDPVLELHLHRCQLAAETGDLGGDGMGLARTSACVGHGFQRCNLSPCRPPVQSSPRRRPAQWNPCADAILRIPQW